jgi:hypothetical protein
MNVTTWVQAGLQGPLVIVFAVLGITPPFPSRGYVSPEHANVCIQSMTDAPGRVLHTDTIKRALHFFYIIRKVTDR